MRGPNIKAHHSLERKVSAMMDCPAEEDVINIEMGHYAMRKWTTETHL